ARRLLECARRPSEAEAIIAAGLGDDVEMHVRDGLVRTRAVVFQDVVLTNAGDGDDGPADARQNSAQGRRGFVGERIEGTRGLLRNDQGVAGTERVDIETGEDLLILIDFVARNRAPQDLAEDGL